MYTSNLYCWWLCDEKKYRQQKYKYCSLKKSEKEKVNLPYIILQLEEIEIEKVQENHHMRDCSLFCLVWLVDVTTEREKEENISN